MGPWGDPKLLANEPETSVPQLILNGQILKKKEKRFINVYLTPHGLKYLQRSSLQLHMLTHTMLFSIPKMVGMP